MSQTAKRGAPLGSKNAAKPEDEKHTKRVPVHLTPTLYAEFASRAKRGGMAATIRELIAGWCDAPEGMDTASPETVQYYNGLYWRAICDIAEALGTGPDEIVDGEGLKLIYKLQGE